MEAFPLPTLAVPWFHLSLPEVRTTVFLQLVAGGHLMLLLVRTKSAFLRPPYPAWALSLAVVGTQVLAAVLAGFSFLVPALGWPLT